MNGWTPELSTGVPLLDEQHQGLFTLVAELESAAIEERTLFGVYTLTLLKNYVREHFYAEESLMKSAAYPDLAEHMAEHAAFRARLGELMLKSIAEDISLETIGFLKDWLVHHVAKTDMKYVPYLSQR